MLIVKWFQVLLYISNNSIKNPSFVYAQLNDQIVLFLTIQFSLRHLFALSLNVKTVLLDPQIGPYLVLPLRARMDLGEMAVKGYSAFLKAPALLEPHHQTV